MTPLELEMLAALKRAEKPLQDAYDFGGSQYNGELDHKGHNAMLAVKTAIAKAEPKPHLWYSDQKSPDSTGCCYCHLDKSDPIHIKPKPRRWEVEFPEYPYVDATPILASKVKVIREVRPITREQIHEAFERARKTEHALNKPHSWSVTFLRELGIDVED